MPLGFFTAILDLKAVIARSSLELDPNPFIQAPSGLAMFIPSVRTVTSDLDERTYFLEPILGRIDNGVLKLVRGQPLNTEIPPELPGEPADHRRYGIRLTANTDALGPLPSLDYRVMFSRVVFNKKEQRVNPRTFAAPNEADVTIDISKQVQRSTRISATR